MMETTMNSSRPLRWAVLGTGAIARRAMIPALQSADSAELVGVASRDAARAAAFANEFGIPRSYGSYADALADDEIDAVYLPLPNHLHLPLTLQALAAGKHVLCEKPLALTAAEAEQMVTAAREAGVHLAEAFMYRHNPRVQVIRDLISDGEIGDVRTIRSSFSFDASAELGNYRFRPDTGGGTLFDIGCYPLSAARLFLGQEPEAVTIHALFSDRHGGVDMSVSGLVEFPEGVSMAFDCSMWAAFRDNLEILGSRGRILTEPAFGGNDVVLETEAGRRVISTPVVDQYALQVDDFAAVVRGAAPVVPSDDPIANMRVLEAALASARTRSRVQIKEGQA